MIINRVATIIVFTFSFLLAFGKFDPFGTDGMYRIILLVMVILSIGLTTNVIKWNKLYRKQLTILILLGILIYIGGLFHEGSSIYDNEINYKYFGAVIIFWFLSYYFHVYPKKCYYSIFLYALSSSLIALAYELGLLNAYVDFNHGRLSIFGENPNSFSARMTIAFIIMSYFLIENPLKFKKYKALIVFTLPSLFLIIVDTGSRGSFIVLIIAIGTMIIVSKVKRRFKVVFILLTMAISIYSFQKFQSTTLAERFNADSGIGSRGEIWKDSMNIYYENPFGVGEYGYFYEMMKRHGEFHVPHNLFIYLLVTSGFFGLILMIIFLKGLFVESLKMVQIGDSFKMTMFVLLFFLAMKTGGILTYLIMWYFFAAINSLDLRRVV